MPIAFSCQSCGRDLRIKDELAGRQIYCPDCKAVLTVPGSTEDDIPEAELAPAASETDDRFSERGDDRPPRIPRPPRDLDEDEWDDDDRPRKKKRRRSVEPSGGSSNGISTIIGGVVIMLIAVIWLVVGLAFDRFFCYPPILFIIGLVAFFRGIYSAATGRD